ncbi:hypothetical protein C8P68_101675 [Mucilaginibacter yixingensis]|uniref:Uncharacterized protein n=1 Tax=Mucilaginibacter yixingensis TaxID=1295612 RepID=A0A2T5JGA8_9SPHI|nr:hypothetical protein [Mucilaginibacter yixingensis]PTR01441.1 hypothetical protein C8P68_101675 [Mucilaginibacter yixingensis]
MKEHRIFRLVIVAIALIFAFARAGQYFFAFAADQTVSVTTSITAQYQHDDAGHDVVLRHMGKAVEDRFASVQLPAILFAGLAFCYLLAAAFSATVQQSSAYSFNPAPLPSGQRLALYGVFRL